ncbi:MAG: site-specific integrase [FCB group bacterium]|nr:site-specific integrase [FCB group bacterium]
MAATKSPRIPKLCLHSSGLGYVRIKGRFHYLGPFGAPETVQRYHALLAQMAATGIDTPLDRLPADLSVAEALELFIQHAKAYYTTGKSKSNGHLCRIQAAVLCCCDLYGLDTVRSFGPLKLRGVQHAMVERGYTRGSINSMVGILKLAFKWLASHEIIPADVSLALTTVPGLRAGKSAAKESAPIAPVATDNIEATLKHLSPPVAAMVRLQLFTAARPGEIVGLKPRDVDTSGEVWIATVVDHKTAHHGKARTLYIGPQGQAVLRPFLLRDQDAPCFSPKEAEAHRHAACAVHRRAKQKANPRKTARKVSDCYSVISYRRAIERACVKAGADIWSPNQLRHTAGTTIRKDFGLDTAQVLLGHSKADTTQIYALADREKAIRAAAQYG